MGDSHVAIPTHRGPVDTRLRRVIGLIAAGFLFLWGDIALGHFSDTGPKHPAMWVPLLFLPCAALIATRAAMHTLPAEQRLFWVVCQLAVLIGIAGFAFHLVRFVRELKGVIQWGVLVRLMRYPPLFAPLAVSGLGVLGVLISDPQARRAQARRSTDPRTHT